MMRSCVYFIYGLMGGLMVDNCSGIDAPLIDSFRPLYSKCTLMVVIRRPFFIYAQPLKKPASPSRTSIIFCKQRPATGAVTGPTE